LPKTKKAKKIGSSFTSGKTKDNPPIFSLIPTAFNTSSAHDTTREQTGGNFYTNTETAWHKDAAQSDHHHSFNLNSIPRFATDQDTNRVSQATETNFKRQKATKTSDASIDVAIV
jgi:hypothetical protein